MIDTTEILVYCIAGAIVAAHASGGSWKLDLPRIAAVAETLGVLPHEIDEGGTHFAAISDGVVVLSLAVPTTGDAHDAAGSLFGPRGTRAPGFLTSVIP